MDLFFIWLGRQEAELFRWLVGPAAPSFVALVILGLTWWYHKKLGAPQTIANDVLSTTVRVQSASAVAQVNAADAQTKAAEAQIKASEALLNYLERKERSVVPELALLPSVSYDREMNSYRFDVECVGLGLALEPAWSLIPITSIRLGDFIWPESMPITAKRFGALDRSLRAGVDWSVSFEVPTTADMIFLLNYRDFQQNVHQSQLLVRFEGETTRSVQGFSSITAETFQEYRKRRLTQALGDPPLHAPWTIRASNPQAGPYLVPSP